ncbi:MAG: tartrate-resistant acid phosphatase type 5 family protein [Asticcacaulis sp.]|uniref:purple acid phosphatase family protein n=1 Tax=Asticcacaulis sp. TaxID=1872648 RepID=UPI0039E5CBB2
MNRLHPTPNRRKVIAGASALVAAAAINDAYAGAAPARSLLIVGDWGRDTAPHQREVASQMDRAAAERACVGVISVGDNFYEDGIQSVDDPKWRTSFEEIYTGASLRPLPWYVALGNHDYGGAPQAQVDYTRRSDRWHMPSRFFKVSGAEMGLPEIDLFVIDTNPLIDHYAEGDDPQAINVRSQDSQAQLAWLDRELAASTAKYKLVAGHHTIFSGGSLHGDTPDMIAKVLPLLKRHGVTAYINGHDHDLQHIARDDLHFVCSGAGSESRPVAAIEGTRFCLARAGFAILSVGADGLDVEYRDYAGATLYRSALAVA